MQLLFLRHGPAESKTDWSGDDDERPLTGQGRSLVREVACALPKQARPDVILTSPLVRARQTAEIAGECLVDPEKIIVDKRLAPGFGAKQLEKVIRDYSDCSTILLVGHDPDFSELVRTLTGGGRLSLRKGGLAQIELPDAKILKGRLVSLLVPTPANTEGPGVDGEP